MNKHVRPCWSYQDERARRWAAIMRLGARLGWQRDDAMAFTRGLTRLPWDQCGCTELGAVLREQQALLDAIQAKAARRQVRSSMGAPDAPAT